MTNEYSEYTRRCPLVSRSGLYKQNDRLGVINPVELCGLISSCNRSARSCSPRVRWPRCRTSSNPVPTDLFEPLRIIPTSVGVDSLCIVNEGVMGKPLMPREESSWNARCVFTRMPGLRYTRKNHCIATPRVMMNNEILDTRATRMVKMKTNGWNENN